MILDSSKFRIQFLKGSPKEHSCEIISKSNQSILKNCLKNSILSIWQREFLMENLPRNIPTKFGPNWPAVWEEKMFKEIVEDAQRTTNTAPP